MNRNYVLISPCRDEAQYMRLTLDAVAAQTLPPALWVIVDDGSTDATPRILADYAARLPWLRVVTRSNRGKRAVGPGVIEAFYAGLETVDLDGFEYLCKLDLDLDLPPRYFETLVEHMEAEPRLGTFSGKPWVQLENERVPEPAGDEMSAGMTKFYRTSCFRQIGGFVREVMWDGIDCHRARLLGWKAGSSDVDPALRFLHLRPMGSSQAGIHTGRQRHGFGQWFMGTGALYMTASSVFRMTHPPYISGGLSMLIGFVKAAWRDAPRYGDERFRRFLRRCQWLMLTRGKRAAMLAIDEEQAWAFDPHRESSPMGATPPAEMPRRIQGADQAVEGQVPVLSLDASRIAESLAAEIAAGRGGWAQVFDSTDQRRYLVNAAFAQRVQDVNLCLAPVKGLVAAIRSRFPQTIAITHEGDGLPGTEVLPRWTWAEREAVLARMRVAVGKSTSPLILVALDSPQQEWLIGSLRHELPERWFLAVGPARGSR